MWWYLRVWFVSRTVRGRPAVKEMCVPEKHPKQDGLHGELGRQPGFVSVMAAKRKHPFSVFPKQTALQEKEAKGKWRTLSRT